MIVKYTLKLTYKDGMTLDIFSYEQETKKLFESLNAGTIYWSKDGKKGFWTNTSDIRYIHIIEMEEDGQTATTQESVKIADDAS
jgi:hypothetical protein